MSVIDIEEAYPTYVLELAEAEANVARLLAALKGLLGKVQCGTALACPLCESAREAIAKAESRS